MPVDGGQEEDRTGQGGMLPALKPKGRKPRLLFSEFFSNQAEGQMLFGRKTLKCRPETLCGRGGSPDRASASPARDGCGTKSKKGPFFGDGSAGWAASPRPCAPDARLPVPASALRGPPSRSGTPLLRGYSFSYHPSCLYHFSTSSPFLKALLHLITQTVSQSQREKVLSSRPHIPALTRHKCLMPKKSCRA